jgi:hypothetical protein
VAKVAANIRIANPHEGGVPTRLVSRQIMTASLARF